MQNTFCFRNLIIDMVENDPKLCVLCGYQGELKLSIMLNVCQRGKNFCIAVRAKVRSRLSTWWPPHVLDLYFCICLIFCNCICFFVPEFVFCICFCIYFIAVGAKVRTGLSSWWPARVLGSAQIYVSTQTLLTLFNPRLLEMNFQIS